MTVSALSARVRTRRVFASVGRPAATPRGCCHRSQGHWTGLTVFGQLIESLRWGDSCNRGKYHMTDYLADVQKYDAKASAETVNKIVKHLGIALRNKDSSLVAASDEK